MYGETGYTQDYIRHCLRYVDEIAKLEIPHMADSFVALECDVGPWAAFRYYDLISDAHYKVLAGARAAPQSKFDEVIALWKEYGLPVLTPRGKRKLKTRRVLMAQYLGDWGKRNERDREHRNYTYLVFAEHLVQHCKASIEQRKQWHYRLFIWSSTQVFEYRNERISRAEINYRRSIFLDGINRGDGPDGVAAGAIRRRCLGATSPEGHRPCILCAYPFPFKTIAERSEHYWNGLVKRRGS